MATVIDVATLLVTLEGDVDDFDRALDNSNKKASGWSDSIKKIGNIALGALAAGATAAAGAIVGLGVGLGKLALESAPLEGIGQAFEKNAETGIVSLEALQKAASGTITDFELMRQANVALTGAGEDFGAEFGESLPVLLEAARAAARATGQDVDFLFESLVTGVKRSSPLMIDNTGIVLKMGEANKALADELGVAVDELTAEQKQIALLRATVAAGKTMIDDYGSSQLTASERIAQFETQIQNTKDSIGVALLPVVSTLIEKLSEIAADVLPIVTAVFDELVGGFEEGLSPIEILIDVLDNFLPQEMIDRIQGTIDAVADFVTQAQEALQPIIDFIVQNVSLQDVLLALGVAIGAVVIPAIIGIVAAVAPIVAAFVGLIAAVKLVKEAWETDWNGIRTTLTEFWENTGKPTLEALITFLQENIPLAIEAAKAFFEETLKPALQAVWQFITESLIPAFETVVTWLVENIPLAIETAKAFWEETLKPALETVWAFITDNIIPVFETVVLWLSENIPIALEALADLWENLLKPALELVWTFAKDNLVPLFEAIVELFDVGLTTALTALAGLWENTLKPALETVWAFIRDNVNPILEGLKSVLDSISGAVQTVIGWINDFAEKLGALQLPDWLNPGSPPPLFFALEDIGAAMRDLSMVELPRLSASVGLIPSPLGLDGMGGGTVNNFNQTINTRATTDVSFQGLRQMQAMVG